MTFMRFQEIKVLAEIIDANGRSESTIVDVVVLAGNHNLDSVMHELRRNHPNCTISIKDVLWVVKLDE